jgi:hypothetical protein
MAYRARVALRHTALRGAVRRQAARNAGTVSPGGVEWEPLRAVAASSPRSAARSMKAAAVKSTSVETAGVKTSAMASSVKTAATMSPTSVTTATMTPASMAPAASRGSEVERGCHDRNRHNSNKRQRNIAGLQHIVLHPCHGGSQSRQRNALSSNQPGGRSVPAGRAGSDARSQPFVGKPSPASPRRAAG